MIKPNNPIAEYWEERYEDQRTGWDMGQVSPPLKAYFDQIEDKSKSILIPGSGNAYEAEYLIASGFSNVHVADIALHPLEHLKQRVGHQAHLHIHHQDFFDIHTKFDLIVEQTFFCAISPERRSDYAIKMADLLKAEGNLVGLLFDFPFNDGPPYGGNAHEYMNYFSPYFNFHTFQRAYNSYYKRYPKEIFINLVKK